MKKDTGGSAFPVSVWDKEGMTLRDYFAVQAMQGMLSDNPKKELNELKAIVDISYYLADAMLEARK